MNKAVFHASTVVLILLLPLLSAPDRSEAAQFSLDLAGAYSSNMEREPGGETGFFALTRFDALASLPPVLHLHSQIGFFFEDKRYQGGDSAQWGEVYVGSLLHQGSIVELSCTASGTYVRESLVPEDDFYAAALEPQIRLHLTPTLDVDLAYYVQWRNYTDKMETRTAGELRRKHEPVDMHNPGEPVRYETRNERTRRTRLELAWMARADMLIMTAGSYSDNTASVAMERWYAWGGEMGLIWDLSPAFGINLWGDITRREYPDTTNRRTDSIKRAGIRANYYLGRGTFYLEIDWERDSSNIAAEIYTGRTLTCGTRFYF